jgi:hypothetical protein
MSVSSSSGGLGGGTVVQPNTSLSMDSADSNSYLNATDEDEIARWSATLPVGKVVIADFWFSPRFRPSG